MSWTTLKAFVASKLYTNGNEEISGQDNQDAVNKVIDDIADYKFGGVITPSTLFTQDTDEQWYFFSNEIGAYPNHGGTNDHATYIVTYNGSFTWHKIDNSYLPEFPNDATLVFKGDGTFGLITTPPNNYTYQPFTSVMGVVLIHSFDADPDIYFKDDLGMSFEPMSVEYTDSNTVTVTFDRLTTGTVLATIGSNSESLENTINVAKSGGDFDNIVDALSSITDATDTNPYSILIAPGVYNENNPIQGKSNVTIKALGGDNTVKITPQNTGNLFDAVDSFFLEDLTLKDVIGASSYAIDHLDSGVVLGKNIVIEDCTNGVHLNNASGQLLINSIALQGTIGKGIFIEGGNATVNDTSVVGLATIDTIAEATSSTTIATFHNILSFSTNVTTGLKVGALSRVVADSASLIGMIDGVVMEGGANLRTGQLRVFNAQQDCVRINDVGSGTRWDCSSCTLEDAVRYNLNVLSDSATITGIGATSLDKFNFTSGSQMFGVMVDIKEDDEGVNILGELHVGTPENGAESALGEGDSYTRGMMVYTYDGVSTYTDVSEEARSATLSTFTFDGVGIDNAIYIASSLMHSSDTLEHYGIKTKVESAIVLGGGKIVIEYWTGSEWTEVNGMEVDSSGSYYPHAKNYFQDIGSHHIRYNGYLAVDSWTKNDPMALGTDYYWTRYRIETAITTAPIFQQFKLHTSRTEINSDGWEEFFGKARGKERFPWDAGLLEAAAASPGNQDLYLSDNLDVGRVENEFANGATDRIGFLTPLPSTIDTSTPVRFSWAVITDDATAGDIDWVLRWGYVSDGGNVYGTQAQAPTTSPNEQSISESLAAPTAANTIKWYSIDLDISDMISRRDGGFGDILFVSLERVAGDTHGGDVALVALNAFYLKWCNGGHI